MKFVSISPSFSSAAIWLYLRCGQALSFFRISLKIPDHAVVSLQIWQPTMGEGFEALIYQMVFPFSPQSERCESLVWRKFAPHLGCLHSIGCYQQSQKSQEKIRRYGGTISASVGHLRKFRTARGHGFRIMHEPSEGIQHVHITFQKSGECDINKKDRGELRIALMDQLFRDQSEHVCA